MSILLQLPFCHPLSDMASDACTYVQSVLIPSDLPNAARTNSTFGSGFCLAAVLVDAEESVSISDVICGVTASLSDHVNRCDRNTLFSTQLADRCARCNKARSTFAMPTRLFSDLGPSSVSAPHNLGP